jgi:hypothetical protein
VSKYDEWVVLLSDARAAACVAAGGWDITQEQYNALSNFKVHQCPRWDLDPSLFVWVRKKPAVKRTHDKSVPTIVRSTGTTYRNEIKVPAPQYWPGGVLPKQFVELIP